MFATEAISRTIRENDTKELIVGTTQRFDEDLSRIPGRDE